MSLAAQQHGIYHSGDNDRNAALVATNITSDTMPGENSTRGNCTNNNKDPSATTTTTAAYDSQITRNHSESPIMPSNHHHQQHQRHHISGYETSDTATTAVPETAAPRLETAAYDGENRYSAADDTTMTQGSSTWKHFRSHQRKSSHTPASHSNSISSSFAASSVPQHPLGKSHGNFKQHQRHRNITNNNNNKTSPKATKYQFIPTPPHAKKWICRKCHQQQLVFQHYRQNLSDGIIFQKSGDLFLRDGVWRGRRLDGGVAGDLAIHSSTSPGKKSYGTSSETNSGTETAAFASNSTTGKVSQSDTPTRLTRHHQTTHTKPTRSQTVLILFILTPYSTQYAPEQMNYLQKCIGPDEGRMKEQLRRQYFMEYAKKQRQSLKEWRELRASQQQQTSIPDQNRKHSSLNDNAEAEQLWELGKPLFRVTHAGETGMKHILHVEPNEYSLSHSLIRESIDYAVKKLKANNIVLLVNSKWNDVDMCRAVHESLDYFMSKCFLWQMDILPKIKLIEQGYTFLNRSSREVSTHAETGRDQRGNAVEEKSSTNESNHKKASPQNGNVSLHKQVKTPSPVVEEENPQSNNSSPKHHHVDSTLPQLYSSKSKIKPRLSWTNAREASAAVTKVDKTKNLVVDGSNLSSRARSQSVSPSDDSTLNPDSDLAAWHTKRDTDQRGPASENINHQNSSKKKLKRNASMAGKRTKRAQKMRSNGIQKPKSLLKSHASDSAVLSSSKRKSPSKHRRTPKDQHNKTVRAPKPTPSQTFSFQMPGARQIVFFPLDESAHQRLVTEFERRFDSSGKDVVCSTLPVNMERREREYKKEKAEMSSQMHCSGYVPHLRSGMQE